jgi:SAM-dependent methyltransferase
MVSVTDMPRRPLSINHRFGLESVEKIVEWASKHVPSSCDPSILEVGSGNGTLLFALVENGYAPDKILGIDYSFDAILLARSIAASRGYERLSFAVCDFLKESPSPLHPAQESSSHLWDLLLDKGTFDAIALSEKDEDGTSPAIHYPVHVANLLKAGAFFLITCMLVFAYHSTTIQPRYVDWSITACNFTEDELRTIFANTKTGLLYQYVPGIGLSPLIQYLAQLPNTISGVHVRGEKRKHLLECGVSKS